MRNNQNTRYPQVILLNGASSSGKTTLISQLRESLPIPYFFLSSDQLVDTGVLPKVDRIRNDTIKSWNVIRPHFFSGFHHSIGAFAKAGNYLIVEHVVEKKEWLDELVQILSPYTVFYIGVMCPIPEINKRERKRGNREIGEGKSHIEDGIHTWSDYDMTVDTFNDSIEENVQKILDGISKIKDNGTVFKQLSPNLLSI